MADPAGSLGSRTFDVSIWESLPDSLVLEVFSFLTVKNFASISRVCKKWLKNSRDDLLWKRLFENTFGTDGCPPPRFFVCWREEFKRLHFETPVVNTQVLTEHTDEVLHATFSNDGAMLASSSKDCSVVLWDVEQGKLRKRDKMEFRAYGWQYVQFCQFNCDDTLLLVSGVESDRHFNFRGW